MIIGIVSGLYWAVMLLGMLFVCTPNYNSPAEVPWDRALGRSVVLFIPIFSTTYFIQEAAWVPWLRPIVFGCLLCGVLAGYFIGVRIERRTK